ncbi:hypothetical protein EV130_11175 [Rhizobium azibense]|uniref:Uncharacterized protein n=1 Tax=Rhizobium azibense TaxID=1136135 RepID=A0A4R3QHI4_9HYPH|nr:hypothetical protein EV130_11175 [Rhizobium azibense]TCU32276.1 hypothetical protein EV129_12165 [Rhizobium azibense]
MYCFWLKNRPFCNMGRIIPIDPSNNCVNQNKTPLPTNLDSASRHMQRHAKLNETEESTA